MIVEKKYVNVEEIISKVKKIFNEIRDEVNNREKEILKEVNKQYIYFYENIIKENKGNIREEIKEDIKENIKEDNMIINEINEVQQKESEIKDNKKLKDEIKEKDNIIIEKKDKSYIKEIENNGVKQNNNNQNNLKNTNEKTDDNIMQLNLININKNKINNEANKISDSESDEDENNINNNKNEYFPKGIKNLGFDDYMNPLLQCLFNIPKLRNYFIEGLKNKIFNKNSSPICYYFANVMKDLLYSDEKYITINSFKECTSKKNIIFKNNKISDQTELFRNLVDSFLDEIESNSQYEIEEEEILREININKETLFKAIQNEIKNNYIYSILNVYNIVTYYCPFHKENEDNITYSIESDSNITFYLANIMENRKKNANSPITLKECFEYIQQEKKNEFYCSKCEKVVKGKSHEKIFYPPEILIIILNRGNGKTFKGNVLIDTILDLSTFIDKDGKELNKLYDKDTYYKIIGSCNHSESSSSAGHYTASCYNEEKNSFYYYNDTSVKKLDKYKYIGEPYILFYKRTKITNYNPTIDNAIIFNPEYQNIKPILNTLFNVFEMLKDKNNNNKNYSIDIIRDNYFIWEIKFEGKIPLIMNFSVDLPNYHLSSLTKLEGINQTLDKYLDIDIDIDLKENERIIYEKILQFLEYVNKNKNLLPNKKDCIIFYNQK